MSAKRKGDTTAGKQKRAAKGAERVEAAPQSLRFNSLGETPSIQISRAGQNLATGLRDEDWTFRELLNESHEAVLVAACYYEYARESEHVPRHDAAVASV